MDFEIIDFHSHPFIKSEDNLCMHKDYLDMNADTTHLDMKNSNISKFCGSVIKKDGSFKSLCECNRDALFLREKYNGDYIPGFQISPDFIDESINEIDYAHKCNVNLIGELVPYMHGWEDYSCKEFSVLLDHIEKYDMTVSLHTIDLEKMETMAKNHPHINFVFAHPGETNNVLEHIRVMKNCDNVFLDISGTGILRYGVLKRLVSEVGGSRILFGTDYPIGNIDSYVHGVLYEKITDSEKEMIFSLNAKKLLNIY